jgi:mediator of replication checkpoint protein 1
MASSCSSSRAGESEPFSPARLTPKSKVRAMLAALDNDSDSEINPVRVRLPLSFSVDQETASGQDPAGEAVPNSKGPANGIEDEGEDGDDEVVAKPRGRLAARMYTTQENIEVDKSISKKRRIRRERDSTPKSSPSNDGRNSPSGLFGSSPLDKSPSATADATDSENDLPTNPGANLRFLALVQKMREERLAKEADAARQNLAKTTERVKLSKHRSDSLKEDDIEFSDDDGARLLTQQARPTRKASKKALEEMHRETQRMSRNMQLAHEARTRKKITKASLFAKFNYKPANSVESEGTEQASLGSSSPARQSDSELKDTLPTSPISQVGQPEVDSGTYKISIGGSSNSKRALPLSPSCPRSKLDKGKGKATEEMNPLPSSNSVTQRVAIFTLRPIRIRPAKILGKGESTSDDSDSDLEIVATKTPLRGSRDSIFDRIPAYQIKEPHPLQALRTLAHLTSPGKQPRRGNTKPTITASELQISLQQRARQQAAREKEERLQALRDRGVIVQTVEERERELAEIEDLIAKARREGEEIMRREKDASRKERKAKGEADPSGESSDDEEWNEEGENSIEKLCESGSESEGLSGEEELEDDEEDENLTEEDMEEAEAKAKRGDLLVDDEASEIDPDEELVASEDEMTDFLNDETDEQPITQPRRRTKQLVVSDDEDEDTVTQHIFPNTESPLTQQPRSPIAPLSVLRSATKTFIPGLTVTGPAGLGLTQIFAGTMDDSQTQSSYIPPKSRTQQLDTAEDSLAFLRNMPVPTLPAFESTMEDDFQEIIRDSQTQISHISESPLNNRASQGIRLQFSQSQIHGFDSLPDPLATQVSDFPEPTQDTGFQALSPIKGRFAQPPPSTVDTIIPENIPAPKDANVSPVVKKGRLRRRTDILSPSSGGDTEGNKRTGVKDTGEFVISVNAFDIMRKTSKGKEHLMPNFDKKKSDAKDMVEEQAQESEDEYAGLGGASDDESGEEEDAYVKEMIDDEGGKDLNASKLAAFYADKERANDEKQVEKLFRDITNGMLRRKRGADYDLSDSDDDGEARRRMKRKEFAKMRKALLEDERIGKIAENPKKLAFLRAIEDRGEDDETDFLDFAPESQEATDSVQSQPQTEDRVGYSPLDTAIMPLKRKLPSDTESGVRLPPHLRRIKPNKRPSNLAEFRESLSSLIEEPNNTVVVQDSGSESEAEDNSRIHEKEEKENKDPFSYRRTKNVPVVDRISLKRASSNATSAGARLAFVAPSSTPTFKVPALLRRATTNSSISSTSGTLSSASSVSGTERGAGGSGDDGKTVTKKAGKNSGVNFFARENERNMAIKKGEKRRVQKMWKGAEKRRKVVGGLLGTGKFE